MLAILAYDTYAKIVWRLAWDWLPYNRKFAGYATEAWIRGNELKADWCAEFVYNGSGWHGLNVDMNGRKMIIVVKPAKNSI